MKPQKYTKRPLTIEAMQLTNDPYVASAVATWCGGMGIASPGRLSLHIQTLEGVMIAHPGDFIIKGVQGEFYPCKPDIFAATYDTPAGDQVIAPTADGPDSITYEVHPEHVIHWAASRGLTLVGPNPEAEGVIFLTGQRDFILEVHHGDKLTDIDGLVVNNNI